MKEGKKSHMTQERIDLLDSIGFVWAMGRDQEWELLWLERFEELRKYKETHGDCQVQRYHPTLGGWVNKQRHNYRIMKGGKKSSFMLQERIDLLDSIGFVWTVGRDQEWDLLWLERFEELRNYKETHGDCLVRRCHPTLGSWVNRQRLNWRNMKDGNKSAMMQERIDLLESINFSFNGK